MKKNILAPGSAEDGTAAQLDEGLFGGAAAAQTEWMSVYHIKCPGPRRWMSYDEICPRAIEVFSEGRFMAVWWTCDHRIWESKQGQCGRLWVSSSRGSMSALQMGDAI